MMSFKTTYLYIRQKETTIKVVSLFFTERGVIIDDSIAKGATRPLLVSNSGDNILNIDNIFMPRSVNRANNIRFIVNTLPYKDSTSSFNMYNNAQSMYNVTYTQMAGFED